MLFELFDRIRELLAENQMDEAVEELRAAVRGTNWEKHAIVLARQHNEIEQDAPICTDYRVLSERRTQLTVQSLNLLEVWETDICRGRGPLQRAAPPPRAAFPPDAIVKQFERQVQSLEERPATPLPTWSEPARPTVEGQDDE